MARGPGCGHIVHWPLVHAPPPLARQLSLYTDHLEHSARFCIITHYHETRDTAQHRRHQEAVSRGYRTMESYERIHGVMS